MWFALHTWASIGVAHPSAFVSSDVGVAIRNSAERKDTKIELSIFMLKGKGRPKDGKARRETSALLFEWICNNVRIGNMRNPAFRARVGRRNHIWGLNPCTSDETKLCIYKTTEPVHSWLCSRSQQSAAQWKNWFFLHVPVALVLVPFHGCWLKSEYFTICMRYGNQISDHHE